MRREFERREEFRPKREFEQQRREHEGPRPPHHHGPEKRFEHRNRSLVTKLFTDKTEMVEYVNKMGENDTKIDVFKIEENLYKVEVVQFK